MIFQLAFALSMVTPFGPLPVPAQDRVLVEYVLPAQRLLTYPAESVLQSVSAIRLSPEAQSAFDIEFRPGAYFGAFAVSKDGGWGYSLGSNSLGAAREIAIAQCASVNTTVCLVVAEITPPGYQPPAAGEVAVSPIVMTHYDDNSTNVKAYAMAISEDGAYAKVWGVPSQAEADQQALSECEANRMASLEGVIDMPCFLLP